MTTPDKEEMPTEDRTAGDFWAEKRDGRWQLQMRHRGPGSSFCVAQINHWADNPEALTTRIADACNAYEPMRKALEKVMVGGNHLGLIIGVDHPPYTASHEEARTHYADAIWTYEVWCCWKTIMEARPALSTLPVNDRHHSGSDNERLRPIRQLVAVANPGDWKDILLHIERISGDASQSGSDRQTSDDVGRLRKATAAIEDDDLRNDLADICTQALADAPEVLADPRGLDVLLDAIVCLFRDKARAALSAPSTDAKVRG